MCISSPSGVRREPQRREALARRNVATIQTMQRTHFYKSMTTYGVIAFGKMCIMCLRSRGRSMWKFTADVVTNLERQFNLATGFTKKDDLPVRLKTELAKTGPAKAMVNGVEKMPPEYYVVRAFSSSRFE